MRKRAKERKEKGASTTSVKDIIANAMNQLSAQSAEIEQQRKELKELREDSRRQIEELNEAHRKEREGLEKKFAKLEERVALKLENMQKKVNIAKDKNTILEKRSDVFKGRIETMTEQLDLLTVEVLGEEEGERSGHGTGSK